MVAINWSNVSTVNDFLATANTNTGNSFWATMLYTFAIILFLALINFGTEVAVLVSLFIGLIVAIILLNLELIGFLHVGIFIGCLLGAIVFFLFSSNKNQ